MCHACTLENLCPESKLNSWDALFRKTKAYAMIIIPGRDLSRALAAKSQGVNQKFNEPLCDNFPQGAAHAVKSPRAYWMDRLIPRASPFVCFSQYQYPYCFRSGYSVLCKNTRAQFPQRPGKVSHFT